MAYLFIGDIHGCIDELEELLGLLSPGPGDTVVSVGDLVDKGPDSSACVRLWRDSGYLAVKGNAEEKLLAGMASSSITIPPVDRAFLEQLPLFLEYRDPSVIVVHGGLFPDQVISKPALDANRDALLKLRFIRRQGDRWKRVPRGKELQGDVFWSTVWDGSHTVIYGHHPTPDGEPRIDPKAIGLDTGCVYGGRLTAVILDGGVRDFASVPARKAYFPV